MLGKHNSLQKEYKVEELIFTLLDVSQEMMPWKTYVHTYFHTLPAHGLIESFGLAVFLLKCRCSGQGITHTWVLPGIYIHSLSTHDPVLCNLSRSKEYKVG